MSPVYQILSLSFLFLFLYSNVIFFFFQKAKDKGLNTVRIMVKGIGPGRQVSLKGTRGLCGYGLYPCSNRGPKTKGTMGPRLLSQRVKQRRVLDHRCLHTCVCV